MVRAVSCDDCKTCLTSPVMSSTNVSIYFKEYKDDERSLTYPSERLVETVSASVNLLEGMLYTGVTYGYTYKEYYVTRCTYSHICTTHCN